MNKNKGFLSDVIVIGLCAAVLVACGEGGSNDDPATARLPANAPPSAAFEVLVQNQLSDPIEGAAVSIHVRGSNYEATTNAAGRAWFPDLPFGAAVVTAVADGFETQSESISLVSALGGWTFDLAAVDAWTVGTPFVLDTSVVQRANDGSSLTFSLDIAIVTGADPEPLLTLSAADFGLERFDCGWGGSRDCASDSSGHTTGLGGIYSIDGGASAFELMSAGDRQPWLAGLVVERTSSFSGWDVLVPALKSFFASVGSNDVIGLASVQPDDGVATLYLHTFTADGGDYAGTIDRLAEEVQDYRQDLEGRILDSLLDAIRWAAVAAGENPERRSTLLVEANTWLSVAQIDEAVALARDSGLRISLVGLDASLRGSANAELALRSGGFVSNLTHVNQLAMAFGVMDEVLGGAMPFYRMQFRLTGVAGTFVAGGNARVYLHVNTPSPIVHRDIYMDVDVAIP